MKKIISCIILLIFLFSIMAAANADGPHKVPASLTPSITFSGTTATCSALLTDPGSVIVITLRLFEGSTLIGTWSNFVSTSIGAVTGYATVQHGHTYTLTGTATVNGQSVYVNPVTATCP